MVPIFEWRRSRTARWAIRYALAAVKKIGFASMQDAGSRTRAHARFADVSDFAARMDARQGHQDAAGGNLARAGAFDTLDPNRARLFAGAETIWRSALARAEEASSGQIGLFGGGGPEKLRLPMVQDWPDIERLGYEAEAVGFHLTAHPLDGFCRPAENAWAWCRRPRCRRAGKQVPRA